MIMRFFGGSRVIASLALSLTILQFACPTQAEAFYNARSPMGTNTNEVLEFDSSVPFIDLFKAALPFREAAPFLTKGRVDYDRLGWPRYIAPGAQAGTRLLSKIPARTIPRGYYIVLYEGDGKIEYGLDAELVESQPGRDVILLDPGPDKEYNVKLEIKETNRNNYIRNIHVVPQGGICAGNPFRRVSNASQCPQKDYMDFERHHSKIIFNPDYLKFMRDYKVIRFMNMSGITRNPIRYWKDRPLVEQATWGGAEGVRGAPLEIMVELANRLHADAWFNIPHAADDDYVRRFAYYVNKHLDPNLKVYIEYSNETWNGIFSQHAYMKKMGKRMKLDSVDHVAGYKFYSLRSVEIFHIFEQAFSGKNRLIRLMAGLTGNSNMTKIMLSFQDAYKHTDAFAIAPYISGDINDLRKARNVNQIFQVMQDAKHGHALPKVLAFIKKQSKVTRHFGVDLLAYEGGQHLIDDRTKNDNQHPNPLFAQANRHPQMGTIYKRLLQGWKDAGGKTFVHFSSPRLYGRFGYVGTKEYITQPDHEAPKHLAITRFIHNNPCWWQGCDSPTVARNKPRPLSTQELARLSGDTASPLPNTAEERGTMEATEGAAGPSGASGTIAAIPQLQPIDHMADAQLEPILAALNSPPREQYAFGRAIAHRAHNPADPLANASTYQLRKVLLGRIDGIHDLAAIWQASWDQHKLHLRIAVSDDAFKRDSFKAWEDDGIEIFLDPDASRRREYDRVNDMHIIYRWRDSTPIFGPNSKRVPIPFRTQHLNGKYVLELNIPWALLGVQARRGHTLGIDIHVNDDDNGNERDGKMAWFSRSDTTWRDPAMMGIMVLGQ